MPAKTIKQLLQEKIGEIIADFTPQSIEYQIEFPPSPELGDYSCNIAMALGRALKKNPLELAEEIKDKLAPRLRPQVEKIAAAKPGFLNFYLSEKFLTGQVPEILKEKENFGRRKAKEKLKIQVEFISANPTGPLTLANARGGFSGDVLANVLALAGHKVFREYYVNDHGEQIRRLGHSVLKDDQAQYKGEYIDDLAARLPEELKESKDAEAIGLWAAQIILKEYLKPAVAKIGVEFDNFFSEKELHAGGQVEKMFEYLKKRDLVYQKDGAWWLRTAETTELSETAPTNKGACPAAPMKSELYGDDKDRVLIKSDGEKTYFLSDIAYHWDKFHQRKFDKAINLWGADHHGYVPRLKSAMAMLGYPGRLEILLMQLMRLAEDGKEVRMSKRKGIYVLLTDLVDEVGLDVTRFFFLMHANNKAMDFDLKLAKEKSSKNPIYYVQYAHARVCSILKKAEGLKTRKENPALHHSEKELIKELIKWPELVEEVAQNYEVHKICFYAAALADKFHEFYENCLVIENDQTIEFRLNLIKAVCQVLQNVLDCLGVSAPEKM